MTSPPLGIGVSEVEKIVDFLEKLLSPVRAHDVVGDWSVSAAGVTELLLPVGVGEKSGHRRSDQRLVAPRV